MGYGMPLTYNPLPITYYLLDPQPETSFDFSPLFSVLGSPFRLAIGDSPDQNTRSIGVRVEMECG